MDYWGFEFLFFKGRYAITGSAKFTTRYVLKSNKEKGKYHFSILTEKTAMERTFAIIKPNAFADGNSGKIISRIYEEGFTVVGLKKLYLSKVEAEGFYHVHKARPFFGELTEFMSSGPCIAMVLEAENAIAKWRDLMGATNPAQAAEGTLRRQFGKSLGENATHGSDAPETAAFEIGYFFAGLELL